MFIIQGFYTGFFVGSVSIASSVVSNTFVCRIHLHQNNVSIKKWLSFEKMLYITKS